MTDGPTSFFDMALSHFWTAQNATDQPTCVSQMATGLQQFCAAVRDASNPNPTAAGYFATALSNFWAAQSQYDLQQLITLSMALQQFCAGTKYLYNPPPS